MDYLDANVFVFALFHKGPQADAAFQTLRDVVDGKHQVTTSTLTIDEVAWVARRRYGKAACVETARHILGLSGIRFLPATVDTAKRAVRLMEQHHTLDPRDAIHAASALDANADTIVSDDTDFDAIAGIRRTPLA